MRKLPLRPSTRDRQAFSGRPIIWPEARSSPPLKANAQWLAPNTCGSPRPSFSNPMKKILRKIGDYFGSAWRLAVLDMKKGRWIVDPAPSRIGYLKAENANGRHILMQPADESRYLLADDLCWERICRQHRHADGMWKPGRMVVETSPQNYQVWIRSQRAIIAY